MNKINWNKFFNVIESHLKFKEMNTFCGVYTLGYRDSANKESTDGEFYREEIISKDLKIRSSFIYNWLSLIKKSYKNVLTVTGIRTPLIINIDINDYNSLKEAINFLNNEVSNPIDISEFDSIENICRIKWVK